MDAPSDRRCKRIASPNMWRWGETAGIAWEVVWWEAISTTYDKHHPYSTLCRGSSPKVNLELRIVSIKITKSIVLETQPMNRQKIRSKIRNSKYIIKPKVMSRSLKLTITNMCDWKFLSIAYCNSFIAHNRLLMKVQLRQIGSNMV